MPGNACLAAHLAAPDGSLPSSVSSDSFTANWSLLQLNHTTILADYNPWCLNHLIMYYSSANIRTEEHSAFLSTIIS